MDSRIALKNGYRLRPEGKDALSYTIAGEMGRGASCIVYDATYETVLGDIKHVRIKECYPFKLRIARDGSGRLTPDGSVAALFEEEKAAVAANFSVVNRLFYSEGLYDSLVNSTDILFGNNTVYIVSAYSGKNTLAQYRPGSLKECVELTKNTAYVIRQIHAQGYLYLDTKPENVLVVEGMVNRIQLFDFDSLWPMSRPEGTRVCQGRISFTKGFAALELQTGRLSSLGPYTDCFGIGALLFWLLFGRAPDSFDGMPEAKYPFEKANYMDVPYRDSLFPLLTEFFHRALAAWHPDRYRAMDEVISALAAIEKLADVTEPYLISSVIIPPSCFFGRESELAAIGEWWRESRNPVLHVTGMGGIGKSTLVKQFISTLDEAPDAVLFFPDSGDLMGSVIDDAVVPINTVERRPEESDEEYYRRKTGALRRLLAGKRVLAVIDNYTGREDPHLCEIKKLGWKLILISRAAAPAGTESLKLEAITDMAALRALFEQNLGRRLPETEAEPFRRMVDAVGGNTLLVELLAKQIASSAMTVEAAAGLLRQHGFADVAGEEVCLNRDDRVVYGTVRNLLYEIFKIDRLSEDEQAVLKLLCLLGSGRVAADEFRSLGGLVNLNTVNRLARLGWIGTGGPALSMHPVISELVDSLPFSAPARTCVSVAAQRLCGEMEREAADETGSPDFARLRRLTDMARSLLKGCDRDSALPALKNPVALRRSVIENLTSEYDDARLEEIDRLLEICSGEHDLLPAHAALELLERKAGIFEDRGEPEKALPIVLEAKRRANRSLNLRAKALYHDMAARYHESRLYAEDRDEDKAQYLRHTGLSVSLTRAAPRYEGKERDLCERLLSRAIMYIRMLPDAEIGGMLDEAEDLVTRHLPEYSQSSYGLSMARAWYLVEKYGDLTAAAEHMDRGKAIAAKIFATPLDHIDRVIIPFARMHFDAADFPGAVRLLQEGVQLCEENGELAPYIRKKYDLLCYRLEVAIAAGDTETADALQETLEAEYARNSDLGLSYYMTPYLQEQLSKIRPK